MLETRDLKRELDKITELALAKDEKSKAKAKSMFSQLRNAVFADIAKTADQRVRSLLKTLSDYSAKKLV